MPTFGELYEFVLAHKKDKTFLGYTDLQIAQMLHDGLNAGTLLVSVNSDSKISGMVLAEILPESDVLFVTENLALSLSNLKRFAMIAKERWPHLKLEWKKHGIYKKHDTQKVYNKLSII